MSSGRCRDSFDLDHAGGDREECVIVRGSVHVSYRYIEHVSKDNRFTALRHFELRHGFFRLR